MEGNWTYDVCLDVKKTECGCVLCNQLLIVYRCAKGNVKENKQVIPNFFLFVFLILAETVPFWETIHPHSISWNQGVAASEEDPILIFFGNVFCQNSSYPEMHWCCPSICLQTQIEMYENGATLRTQCLCQQKWFLNFPLFDHIKFRNTPTDKKFVKILVLFVAKKFINIIEMSVYSLTLSRYM